MDNETERLSKVVNSSGFPFQIGVQYQIKQTKGVHGWEIVSHEYPWKNPETGNEGFIDIIISKNSHTMVIECKKASGGEWIFLVPQGKTDTHHGQCRLIEYKKGKLSRAVYQDLLVEPNSPQSEFCIIKGQNESKPTLERISTILLESTESFELINSKMRNRKFRDVPPELQPPAFYMLYFPVIVINSNIRTCYYDPDKISMIDGKLQNAEFEEVPSVRFRKSLSTSQYVKEDSFSTIKEVYEARERVVYVVNSNHLIDFLKEWEVTS